jgi:transforming growth factor-beta-induced protein
MTRFVTIATLVLLSLSATTRFGAYADCTKMGEDARKDIVETALAAGRFEMLLTAIKAAGLVDILKSPGPSTVFAPTDEAFAKLPKETLQSLLANPDQLAAVLKYHVVAGRFTSGEILQVSSATTALGQEIRFKSNEGVKFGTADLIQKDLAASNGVIHVIDTVQIPAEDIIEVARSAGSFKTLLAALDTAQLTSVLRAEGPFTVFAPTDEAFAKLPKEKVEALLKDKAKLSSILTYHVLPGRVMAANVVNLSEAKTVQGQSVKIDVSSGVTVDGARVVKTDVPATNGVIHVIDTVLLPRDVKLETAGGDIGNNIRLAIERGVPLFNSGNVEACAAVYEIAATTILDLASEQLNDKGRARLERGLREARHADNARGRAWALRHAFDDLLAAEHAALKVAESGK